jgi:phosphoglycolate phosphatase-like HAD superfamily hydrolase
MTDGAALRSWRDTATRRAIEEFAASPARKIPPAERIAVFDNDGTLWTEKPMPVQLDFILRDFAAAAEADPGKRARQPYKAAYERDHDRLGRAMVKHYRGDDSELRLLIGALSESSAGVDVETYAEQVLAFFADAEHPTLRRPYSACGFVPMIELLRYLDAYGFLTFIVSGGDRDFMRPAAERIYGIPRERVAGGNSNGDLEMLQFAGGAGKPALGLVVRHDDAEREVDDRSGAEHVLDAGFTEISMRDDWTTVFAP